MTMSIIGNWKKCVLFLFTLNLNACDLSFKILNYAGEQVAKVHVGVPFQLHLIAKGDCEFDRLEFNQDFEICNLTSLGVMKSINNINGVVSKTNVHKYLARIDQPGRYK